MNDVQWRFPDNRYSSENGLDTSDMETFKKDPVSSLAREICQNSIDAARSSSPVRVEFHLFEVPRSEIPCIDELTTQIERCCEFRKNDPKEAPALELLRKNIKADTIPCLRISDFNTTGVLGVSTGGRDTPFGQLTKGSGVSAKTGSSGGSKGIGKFASFVASTTNTVFYSTYTEKGERGHFGICKLRSVPIDGSDDDLLTLGIGYYGRSEKNLPIEGCLSLDKDFVRKPFEFGTDVYLIGFDAKSGWKCSIISKVLESFMVAIYQGVLEVSVGGQVVNKDTAKGIIFGDEFKRSGRTPTELRDIIAQYELLECGDSVTKREVVLNEETVADLYIKQYGQKDVRMATRRCVMVRYPLMKITYINVGVCLPCSALCVIRDNELNRKLRSIENPQHTDWEINRLNSFPEEKKAVRKLQRSFERTVLEILHDVLSENAGDAMDIEGAGEFLPSPFDNGEPGDKETEKIKMTPLIPAHAKEQTTGSSGSDIESRKLGLGSLSKKGEKGAPVNGSKRKKKKIRLTRVVKPMVDPPRVGAGTSLVSKPFSLDRIRYRVISAGGAGKYDCVFTSLYDAPNCDFSVQMCGDSGDKYPLEIVNASVSGKSCSIKDGKVVGLALKKGKQYKLSYAVNQEGLFASEVCINANR